MTKKNLTTGSIIIMIILIIMTLAASKAVDKSVSSSTPLQADQANNDPSIRSGNTPLKGELEPSPSASVSIESASKNPGLFSRLLEKMMLDLINLIDPSSKQPAEPVNSTSSRVDYEKLLEEYPLDAEQLAEIKKYSGDKSPAELIEAYCEDAQTPEFQEMITSIKTTYANDPNSPASLMEVFETMAQFCPQTE
jgi:hypothetical protein